MPVTHQEGDCAPSHDKRPFASVHSMHTPLTIRDGYLSCMSMVTALKPLTALATRTATLMSARELTKPLLPLPVLLKPPRKAHIGSSAVCGTAHREAR